MALRYSKDGQRVYVANYLLNAIQVVDPHGRKVERTIDLGGPAEPSLVRQGETIFYDGQRSLDQWYSCASCHYEGHTNSLVMDTRNDGRNGNYKVVLSLRNVTRTGPWTWHGWQKDIETAMHKSLTDSMLGKAPSEEEIKALVAFLDTLEHPANPRRGPDGKLGEAAQRGQRVFNQAGCLDCHSGPFYTDGKVHDVGLATRGDAYQGFNPPSLLGAYDRLLYLHDGRSRSIEEVLLGPHSPAKVTGRSLAENELKDLVEYLKGL
jgi:YVTN family beta-propeller protein